MLPLGHAALENFFCATLWKRVDKMLKGKVWRGGFNRADAPLGLTARRGGGVRKRRSGAPGGYKKHSLYGGVLCRWGVLASLRWALVANISTTFRRV